VRASVFPYERNICWSCDEWGGGSGGFVGGLRRVKYTSRTYASGRRVWWTAGSGLSKDQWTGNAQGSRGVAQGRGTKG